MRRRLFRCSTINFPWSSFSGTLRQSLTIAKLSEYFSDPWRVGPNQADRPSVAASPSSAIIAPAYSNMKAQRGAVVHDEATFHA